MATFTGTNNADTANATTGTLIGFTGGTVAELQDGIGDTIVGLGGPDTIIAGSGNDTLIGGADADTLNGGGGSDTASYATAGAAITARLDLAFGLDVGGVFDTYTSIENVTGSDFADVIVGKGGEANTLSGGQGDDTFIGEGIDTVNGGSGNDVFFGGQGSALNINLATASLETVWGSFVGDVMDGSTATANLTMVGQGLTGGANADTMTGGSGDDFIYFRAGDVINGGTGNDWAVATLSAAGVSLNMTATGFENAWGSTSDDLITAAGSATAAVIVGDVGDDTLTGGNAGDFLYGFGDNDTLTGGGGNDHLIGGTGTDTFAFGAGWGIDIVWDWVNGSEQFDLAGSGVTQFSQLTLTTVGANAVASFAGNQIWVINGAGQIDATDFLFDPSVWFIDNTAPGSTNVGTQANPFTSIAAFNAAQGTLNGPDAGAFVYLRDGTYTEADGINLANGQTLVGQGQNLVVNGVIIETGSAGQTPNIVVNGGANDGIDLAQNNTISGLNVSTTTGTGKGIDDNGNVGTLNISDISVSTASGTGIELIGGGTVTVTGPGNTISSGTGTALNITNTTIGAADVTFQSISSNGGSATGIILDTTGALGGLHVTGTGTAGSGGTIANKTGANGSTTTGVGIYLNNTADVQLDRMQLNDFQNFAIQATDLNGFSLQNSVVSGNNGNDAGSDEGAILIANSSGTINIANSQISGGFEDNLRVLYDSATADTAVYNITNNDFTDLQSGNNALVNLRSATTASASSNVTFNFGSPSDPALGNTFDNSANQNPSPPPATQWFGDGILVTFEGPFQHNINIDNNTFNELFQAIDFAGNFSADVNARIYNNTITFTEGVGAIVFGTGSNSTSSMLFQMLIEDNDIGGLGNDSGSRLGSGIVGDFRGAETARVTIHQNVVRDTEVNPINIISQMTTGGDGDTHLRITNNTIASIDDDEGGGAGVIPGINVTTNAATNGDIFLTISGNIASSINEDGILVRQATANNTFSLEDFAGNGTVATDVDAYLEAQNPGTTARVRTGGSVVQYTTMNQNNTNTPAPLTPLLADDGGVEAADDGTPDGVLTGEVIATLADAAVARWAAAGLSAEQVATLEGITITVADLAGDDLGHFDSDRIVIDSDAAGRGWFIDDTPLDDIEFGNVLSGTWLQTDPTSAPAGHYDLLTTIMHEMGHGLGLDDLTAADARDVLMFDHLVTGERRLPGAVDLQPTPASHDWLLGG